MATVRPLSLNQDERAASGFTHKWLFKYNDTDLAAASTSATIPLITLAARQGIFGAAFSLNTVFSDGAATMSSCTLKVGWDTTGADDDGIIAAVELEVTGTEILGGDATGAAFATLRTGQVMQGAATVNAIFTATGANLSTLIAGELALFMKIVDLSKL